jgi:hypothetical protein
MRVRMRDDVRDSMRVSDAQDRATCDSPLKREGPISSPSPFKGEGPISSPSPFKGEGPISSPSPFKGEGRGEGQSRQPNPETGIPCCVNFLRQPELYTIPCASTLLDNTNCAIPLRGMVHGCMGIRHAAFGTKRCGDERPSWQMQAPAAAHRSNHNERNLI